MLENKTNKIYKQEKQLTDIIQNIKSGLSLKMKMILKQLIIRNVGLKVHKDKVQYLIKKINFDSDLMIHETIFLFFINIHIIIFMKFMQLI